MTDIRLGWHVNTPREAAALEFQVKTSVFCKHLAIQTCVYTLQNGFTMLRSSPSKTSKEKSSPWKISSGVFAAREDVF